jgi:hypothetical protein
MQSGLFEPPKTPEQFAALKRLETLLALVEGWVDVVVNDAVAERLPGADALRETLRRRRASGGPAEQTFATLVGLELRPRRLRASAELWRTLTTERGADGRDAVWAHPDLIPTEDDLAEPKAFVSRAQDDSSDPIAELERTVQAERDAEAQDTTTQRDAGTERDNTDSPSRGSNVSHESDARAEDDKNNPPSTGSA